MLKKNVPRMTISLPWPPKELSPNARVHWKEKHSASRKYRGFCHWVLLTYRRALHGKRRFLITFRRPDRRAMDMDNAIASFKAGQDALSLVTNIDDKFFACTYAFGEPVKGGAVEITVLDAAEAA